MARLPDTTATSRFLVEMSAEGDDDSLAVDKIEEIGSVPPPQPERCEDKGQHLEESKTEPEDLQEESLEKDVASKKPRRSSSAPSVVPRERKESIFQRLMKRMPKILTPKVHSADNDTDSEETPPPLPANYPSTEEFLQRIEFRKQKHRFGAQKVEYYLRQAEQGNINVDEIVMKSSLGLTFIERR